MLPRPLPLYLSPSVLGHACAVCGVIIIDFQRPNLSVGSSSGSRSREGSEKACRQVYFQVELGKNNFCTATTAVALQAINSTPIRQVFYEAENWVNIELQISADPHTSDGIPRLGISFVYVSTFGFYAYALNIILGTWYDNESIHFSVR